MAADTAQATTIEAPDTWEVEQDALVEDVLVEEVSIDGLCGVY